MSLTTAPEDVLVHLTSPAREKELAQVTKDTRYVQNRNLYLPIPRGSRTGGGTTATQLEIIQKSFDVFCDLDKDGDRVMSHNELKSALQMYSQQLDVNDAQVARIMEIAGSTRPGYLTFSEFYHVYSALNVVTHLQHADVEHLEPVHVRQALEQTGLTPTKGQIEKIFQLGDKYKTADRLGRIDFGEFLKAYVQSTMDAPQIYLHAWHSAGRNSTPYNKPAEVSAFQDFVAGTMAGVALTLVGHPFDTIKVRMQTAGHFRGGLDVLFQTLRKEGVMALFKGMGGPMATIPLVNAVVFASYGKAKEILHKIQPVVKPLNLWEISMAGAFAGLVNCLIVCPVELIKTRLQIQYSYAGSPAAFTGAFDCVNRIYQQNGIKGLYRGMSATIYRELPGYGGQFFMYEALKQRFTKPGETSEDLSAPALILAGGTAGIFGWILSYPMDYVKSQIQAEPYNKKTLFTKNKYLFDGGFISCWKHTVREGGYKALFRGFGPCIARAFPANAAGFLAYEWTLKVVRIYDQPLEI